MPSPARASISISYDEDEQAKETKRISRIFGRYVLTSFHVSYPAADIVHRASRLGFVGGLKCKGKKKKILRRESSCQRR